MSTDCQWWLWMLVAVAYSLHGGLVEAELGCVTQLTNFTLEENQIKSVAIERVRMVNLKCETMSMEGDIIIINGWTFHPSNNQESNHYITENTNQAKYSLRADTLTVKDLNVSDEGVYVCNFSLNNKSAMEALGGAVVILGSPYIIPYSMENITVCSGQDIVLNATLEFRDSGACMQHIEIAQRILEMNNVHLVTCPTSSSCTIKSERFHVNITETTMVVTISDATQDDSGIYKFFPDTTLSRVTTKFFTVTVSEPSTSVISVFSTPATTSILPSITPTVTLEKTSQEKGLKSNEIAAVVLTLLLVPSVVVFLIVAVIYFFRWRNQRPPKIPPKMKFDMKPTEPFYDNVNIITPSNGSMHTTSEDCTYLTHAPSSIAGDRTSRNMEDVLLAEKPTDEEANV